MREAARIADFQMGWWLRAFPHFGADSGVEATFAREP